MLRLYIVLFLCVYRHTCVTIKNQRAIFIGKNKQTLGYNETPYKKEEEGLLKKIYGFYKKKQTLEILQSPEISESYKLQVISEDNIGNNIVSDLTKGGLFKDFDFTMNEK